MFSFLLVASVAVLAIALAFYAVTKGFDVRFKGWGVDLELRRTQFSPSDDYSESAQPLSLNKTPSLADVLYASQNCCQRRERRDELLRLPLDQSDHNVTLR